MLMALRQGEVGIWVAEAQSFIQPMATCWFEGRPFQGTAA